MTYAKLLAAGLIVLSGCRAPGGAQVELQTQCGPSSLSGSGGTFTLFCNSARPSKMAQATQSIELGLKFEADVDGFVKGVRFYKDLANTGAHSGILDAQRDAPETGIYRWHGVPVVRIMRVIARVIDDVPSGLQSERFVHHAVLRRATRRL